MNLNNTKTIHEILKEVINSAKTASASQLEQLEAQGPKFAVQDADLFGNPTSGIVGTMLDNCGGAYLTVSGKSKLVRDIKKCCENVGDKYRPEFRGEDWSLWKGVYKGYVLHLSVTNRQEMAVHISAMNVAQKRLAEFGYDTRVYSYID